MIQKKTPKGWYDCNSSNPVTRNPQGGHYCIISTLRDLPQSILSFTIMPFLWDIFLRSGILWLSQMRIKSLLSINTPSFQIVFYYSVLTMKINSFSLATF
jgi:hypothetical protein